MLIAALALTVASTARADNWPQWRGPYYNGSTDEDRRAEITVPHDGDWAIRVYLMGNDRDTGKTVGYNLDLSIQ